MRLSHYLRTQRLIILGRATSVTWVVPPSSQRCGSSGAVPPPAPRESASEAFGHPKLIERLRFDAAGLSRAGPI